MFNKCASIMIGCSMIRESKPKPGKDGPYRTNLSAKTNMKIRSKRMDQEEKTKHSIKGTMFCFMNNFISLSPRFY